MTMPIETIAREMAALVRSWMEEMSHVVDNEGESVARANSIECEYILDEFAKWESEQS